MIRCRRVLAPLLLLATVVACGGDERPADADGNLQFMGEDEGGPPTAEALVDSLKQNGIAIRAIGISNPVWFSPKGIFFAMAGDNVQVFEYQDAAEARADVAKVAASGDSVAGSTIPGKGPATFYRRGPLIVLVQGDSDRLRVALERFLGDPVAGPGSAEDATAAGE